MPKIAIHKCPKTYIRETHRSKEPASTLDSIKGLVRLTGMDGVKEITGADRTQIPAFLCNRTRPDKSRTTHTGKGLAAEQAQCSLIMEAVERYCSEYMDEYADGLVSGSFEKLRHGRNLLDPEELFPGRNSSYLPDTEIHWVAGFELVRQEEILVPACSVYHPFWLDAAPPFDTHTNGLASGNTIEEAIFHALTEVIERDAWSIAKFRNDACEAILVEDSPESSFLLDIIARFEAAQIQVSAKDITSELGVPAVAAFGADILYPDLMVMDGFGCHLDPKVALARALLELAVTRATFLHKYGKRGLRDSGGYFEDETGDYRFLCEGEKALGDIPSEFTDDIGKDIGIVLGKLRQRGFDKVAVVDLTRRDAGIPVVRVIVPGMEVYCFDRSRRGPRLYGIE